MRRALAIFSAVAVAVGVLAVADPAGAANPWVRVPAPSPAGEQGLTSVSCTTPTTCVAVGFFVNGGKTRTLSVKTTDGVTWTRVASPNPGAEVSELFDVSCVSATHCTAVGTYASTMIDPSTPRYRSFVLKMTDGSTWQRVTSPNPFGFPTLLFSVNCVTATRCRAVGTAGGNTLVLRTGDGTNWFRQETPNLGNAANYLLALDCVSNVNCTAVGLYFQNATATSRERTLALRTTDGRNWFPVTTPNPAPNTSATALQDVDCTSRTTCVATGWVDPSPGPTKRAFILRTTNGGNSWARAATPSAPGLVDIYGVSCRSVLQCTGVGWAWSAGGDTITTALLRTTDGTNWTSPNPASERLGWGLAGVSCALADQCVAVGSFNATGDPDDPGRSLVMKET